MLRKLLLVLLVAIAAWALIMTLLSYFSGKPTNLGPRDGRLADCPDTSNCVSSQSSEERHAIEPLRFEGDADAAWDRLRAVLALWPRTRIVSSDENYFHAESTSLVFRFVDDLECLLDRDAKLIHVRSASRVGRSDLGVNRRRVERLRQEFNDTAVAQ